MEQTAHINRLFTFTLPELADGATYTLVSILDDTGFSFLDDTGTSTSWLRFVPSTRTLTGTPDELDKGTSLTVTLSGGGQTYTHTISVPANPPVFSDFTVDLLENKAPTRDDDNEITKPLVLVDDLEDHVADEDEDEGDSFTFTFADSVPQAIRNLFAIEGASLEYIGSAQDYETATTRSWTFDIVVTDSYGLTDTATATVSLTDVGGGTEPPALNRIVPRTIEDTETADDFADLTGTFSMPNASVLQAFFAQRSSNIRFNVEGAEADISESGFTHSVTGTYGKLYYSNILIGGILGGRTNYKYVPDDAKINALGPAGATETFTVRVTDGVGTSGPHTLTINIKGADDDIVFSMPDNLTIAENQIGVIGDPVTATDPEGVATILSYSLSGAPAGFAIATNGQISYTGTPFDYDTLTQDGRSISFTVVANLAGGGTAEQEVTVSVTNVNEEPIIVRSYLSFDATTVLTNAHLLTTDPDNSASQLTYTLTDFSTLGKFQKQGDHDSNPATPDSWQDAGIFVTFTQADIEAGNVRYVPVSSTIAQSARFTFSVTDGTYPVAGTLTVFNGLLTSPRRTIIQDTATNDNFADIWGSFTVTTGQTITVKVNGGNSFGTTKRETNPATITDQNPQGTETRFTHTANGVYGKFFYNENTGAYWYRVNDAKVNELTANQLFVDIIEVTGGGTGTLIIEVRGADETSVSVNQAPILPTPSGPTYINTQQTNDDFTNAAPAGESGNFGATDPDAGDTITYTVAQGQTQALPTSESGFTHSVTGSYGTLFYNQGTGAYKYAPDNAKMNAVGESGATDIFLVTASDGTISNIQKFIVSITDVASVTGTNTIVFSGTDNLGIAENQVGTEENPVTIGTVTASDSEGLVSITSYDLEDEPSGFEISSTGAITYKGAAYDYEALTPEARSITFRVVATFSDSSTAEQEVTVSVTNVNEAPVITHKTFTYISGQTTIVLTSDDLLTSDIDSRADQLTYTITNAVIAAGKFEVFTAGSWSRPAHNAVFTQADIDAGRVRYAPTNPQATANTNVPFAVSDGTTTLGGQQLAINVNPNQPPVIGNHVLEHQGSTIVLTAAHLSATDADNAAADLTYNINHLFFPAGKFETSTDGVNWNRPAAGVSFTKADLDAGHVRYVPTAGATKNVAAGVTITDGRGGSVSGHLAIIIDDDDTATPSIAIADTEMDNDFADIWGSFTVATGQTITVQVNGNAGFPNSRSETNPATITDQNPQGTPTQFTHTADGVYGKFFYNENTGAYWYRINDASDDKINALTNGQRVADIIEVTGGATETLIIDITGANERPVVQPISGPTYTDTQAVDDFTDDDPAGETGTFTATDAESDSLTYIVAHGTTTATQTSMTTRRTLKTVTEGDTTTTIYSTHSVEGAYGTLHYNKDTGDYEYVPNNDDMNGVGAGTHTDEFQVTANDGSDDSAAQTFTVTINGADDGVTAYFNQLFSFTLPELADGSRYTLVSVTDSNGNTVNFHWLNFAASTGTLSGTPTSTETETLTVTLSGGGETHTYTISVSTSPPVFADFTVDLLENAGTTTLVNDLEAHVTDTDTGETFTFEFADSVPQSIKNLFRITASGGLEYYGTGQDYEGASAVRSWTFDIVVTDSDGRTDTATATVRLTDVGGEGEPPALDRISEGRYMDTEGVNNFQSISGQVFITPASAGEFSKLRAGTEDDLRLQYQFEDAVAGTRQPFYTHRVDGDYGTLYYWEMQGVYLYVPDDTKMNGVGPAGAIETFTARVRIVNFDTSAVVQTSGPHTLTINIQGADDAVVWSVPASLTLAENQAETTQSPVIIGTVTARDPEGLTISSYALSGTDADNFAIDANGRITYKGPALNFEGLTAPQRNISLTVTATLSDTSTATQEVTITVTDVNEDPVLEQKTLTYIQGEAHIILTREHLLTTDVDAANSATPLAYRLSNNDIAAGHFERFAGQNWIDPADDSNNPNNIIVFSQADIDAGRVRFVPDNPQTFTSTTVTFDIIQSGTNFNLLDQTLTINVIPNQAPIVEHNFLEHTGSTITLTQAHLSTTDGDNTADQLTYTITSLPTGAALQILGDHDNDVNTADTWADIALQGTFTQADINAGKVRFVPSTTAPDATIIGFSVADNRGASETARLTTLKTGASDHIITDTATNDDFANIWGNFNAEQGESLRVHVNGILVGGTKKTETNLQDESITFTLFQNGVYGKFFYVGNPLNEDGTPNSHYGIYWYRINDASDAKINALEAGQRVFDVIEVTYKKATDNSIIKIETVVIDIRGAEDNIFLPPLSGPTYADTDVTDDFAGSPAPTDATGTFTASDPDTEGVTITYSITHGTRTAAPDISQSGFTHSVQGSYGKLFYNQGTGAYKYVPDNAKMNAVSADGATDEFSVTASAGASNTSTQTFTVTITGGNDPATAFTVPTGLTIGDDRDGSDTAIDIGTVTATDIDNTDFTLIGAPEGFSITSAGVIQYTGTGLTFDADTPANNIITFQVRADNLDPQSVTITVLDTPNVERSLFSHSGATVTLTKTHLLAIDADTTRADQLTYTITDLPNAGTLQIWTDANSDNIKQETEWADIALQGTFTQADINNGRVRYVPTRPSDARSERVSFTISDGVNTSEEQQLTILVTGKDSVTTHEVRDTADYDDFANIWGSFTVEKGDGFSVKVNDRVVFTSGRSEPNLQGDLVSFTLTQNGVYGKFFYDDKVKLPGTSPPVDNPMFGTYWYRIDDTKGEDARINALKDGQRVADIIEATITQANGVIRTETIIIDIRGANDLPVLPPISGPTYTDTAIADDFTDDTPTGESGNFGATDADAGDSIRYTVAQGTTTAAADPSESGFTHSVQGRYGKLFYNQDGDYKYVPNNDRMNEVGEDGAREGFQVRAYDSTNLWSSQTLFVTIEGEDDTATAFTVPTGLAVDENEDGSRTAIDTGNPVTATDIDGGTQFTLSGARASEFRITSTGYIQYIGTGLDYEAENQDGDPTIELMVRADNLPAQTVTITINDGTEHPIFNHITGLYEIAEGQDGSGEGNAIDIGDPVTARRLGSTGPIQYRLDAPEGLEGFAIDANGQITYTGTGLAPRATTPTITLTVWATFAEDPSGTIATSLRITVTDRPTLTTPQSHMIRDTAQYNDFPAQTGQFQASTDFDSTRIIYEVQGATAGPSAPAEGQPETRKQVATVESNPIYATHSVAGTYGTLYYNQNTGHYAYEPDDAEINALPVPAGNIPSDSFSVTANYRSLASIAKSLRIDIRGADDAVAFSGTDDLTIAENQDGSPPNPAIEIGTIRAFDPEGVIPDSAYTYSLLDTTGNPLAADVKFAIHPTTGLITYTGPAFDYEGLTEEQRSFSFDVSVSYTVNGVFSIRQQTVTITVEDVNEAPIIEQNTLFYDIGDTAIVLTASHLSTTDDDEDQLTYTITGTLPSAGNLQIWTDANSDDTAQETEWSDIALQGTFTQADIVAGRVRYVPDDPQGTTSAQFSFTVTDGEISKTDTLNIIVGGGDHSIMDSIDEDTFRDYWGDVTIEASETITVSAEGQTPSLTAETAQNLQGQTVQFTHSLTGAYGTLFYVYSTGVYLYRADADKINELPANRRVVDIFTITPSGTTPPVPFVVDISGANDRPILDDIATPDAIEDTFRASDTFNPITGQFTASDADNEDSSLTYSVQGGAADPSESGFDYSVTGSYGKLFYNQGTGAYKYVPDNAKINALTADASETFSVTASDGTEDSTAKTLTIPITGALFEFPNQLLYLDSTAIDDFTDDNPAGETGRFAEASSTTYSVTEIETIPFIRATFTGTSTTTRTPEAQEDTSKLLHTASGTGVETYSTHKVTDTYGTLYFNRDTGHYIFEPDNDAMNAISSGLGILVTFQITATTTAPTARTEDGDFRIITFGANDPATAFTVPTGLTINAGEDGRITPIDVVGGLVTATDIDNTQFTLSGARANEFSITSTGQIQYQGSGLNFATENADNDPTITLQVSADGRPAQTVTITVEDANTAPVLTAITETIVNRPSTTETFNDVTGDFDDSATDADDDTLTYSVTDAVALDQTNTADKAEFDLGFTHKVTTGTYGTLYYNDRTGNYKYVPKAGDINALSAGASDEFTVTANDGTDSSTAQTLTVNINYDDTPPPIFNAFSDDHAVAENLNRANNPLNVGSPITANARDAVTYSLKNNPEDWTIHSTLGQIQYRGSGYDFETTPTVTLTVVATANGLTAEQEVTISITDEDEVPTAFTLSATSDSVGAGTSAKRKLATIEITDDELGTNTPTVTAGGTYFEIVRETDGSYALYLKAGQTLTQATSQTATISLTASGSGTGPADQTFTLNVVAAADAPTFPESGTYSFTTVENQDGSPPNTAIDIGTVTASGGQGTITYNLIGAPEGFDIGTNGQITYEGAGLNFEATPTITLTVRAAAGGVSSTRDVTITVTNVNDAPVIVRSALYYNSGKLDAVLDSSDLLTTDEDTTDGAGDLTYTITSLSNAGVLQILGDHDDDAQTDDEWQDITATFNTFTQADINAGRVRYVPTYTTNEQNERVDPGATSFTFTVADGGENEIGPVSGTLNIDFRTDVTITNPDGANIIDLSRETGARRVDTGTSNDQIITSPFNDQIIGGTGNDDIRLAGRDGQTGGADEIFYTFTGGTNWKNHFVDGNVLRGDGGDTITGFTRGEDKIIFRTGQDETTARTLDAFLTQADGQIRLRGILDTSTFTHYKGISLQFLGNGASFTGEQFWLKIEFATGLTRDDFDELVRLSSDDDNVGGGSTGAYIRDISVLERLLGEGSLDFQIISPPTFDSSSYSFDIDENIGWNGITPVYIGTPVSATDPENYVVTYTLTQEGASFNIDRLTGQIRYVGNNGLDHEATPSITVTVTAISSSGGRATQEVTITVNNVEEPPEFDDLPTDLTIAENLVRSADNLETVGSPIQATDPENAGAVTYRFEETQTDWEIDETSGQISYKGAGLDHETTPTVTLRVRATDAGSPALHSTQDVEITVSDEDEDPDFGTVPTNLEIAENRNGAAVRSEVDNSIVGIAVTGDDFEASDPDDGDTITYRFETAQTNWRIDSATGQIYYIGAGLDHETEETVTLAIIVASTGTSGTEKTDRASVTISVGDEDEAPEFDAAPTLTIAENQAGPHVIGSVSATDEDDGDDVAFSFETEQTVWMINPTSGQISYTGSAFDYDTLAEAARTVTLTIIATSGRSGEEQTATQEVTITVENVDEDPEFGTAPANLEIAENRDGSAVRSETDNSIIIGIEVAGDAFSATDEDGDAITYRFRTDQTDWRIDETTRKIYYIGSGLDFETTPTVDLIIVAASTASGGTEKTAEQTLRITVSDDAPVFNPLPTDLTLNENVAGSPANPENIGSEVTATYPGHTVTYSLKDGAPTGWQIVETTGQIQYTGPALNYEALTATGAREITFTIIATANGEEAEQQVTITVEDVDERPEFGAAPADLTIAENQAAHTIANSEVTATDPDGDAVSYSLQDAPANFELVAGQNGGMQIRYTGSGFNYETLATDQRIITLTVVATSTNDEGIEKTAQQTVTITITNVDEFAPVFDPVSGTYQIRGNRDGSETPIPIGAPIKARDADGDAITYRLEDIDGNPPTDYEITSTGQIRYKGSGFDYAALTPEQRSIVLTVVATSGVSGAEKTAEQDVTINLVGMLMVVDSVIDENEAGPVDLGNPFPQIQAGGTPEWSLQSPPAGFTINPATGDVTYTGSGLDHEATPTIDLKATVRTNGASEELDGTITVRDVNEAPVIERSRLAFDRGEGAIVLDSTHLFTTDEDAADSADQLTYTITSLANAGKLQIWTDANSDDTAQETEWSDIALQGRFTQADIEAGRVRYVPPANGQAPTDADFGFTVEDGGENGVGAVSGTLNIDVRQIVTTATPEDSDNIDLDTAGTARSKTVNTGNGLDTIRTGTGNDEIAGGLGNDEIRLQNDQGEEDGADTVIYTFSVSERGDWVTYDGADRITGFTRGEDKIIFQIDRAQITDVDNLNEFLLAARGADGIALTKDDQFQVQPRFVYDSGNAEVSGIAFYFRDAGNYGNGKFAIGSLVIEFAARLTPEAFVDLVRKSDTNINIASTLAIEDLTVLPTLLGENSIEFRIIETTGIAADSETSGRVVEDSRRFTTAEGQVILENPQIGAAYSLSVQLGSSAAIAIDADGEIITGTYGTLTVKQDGTWVYTINNGDDDTEDLTGTDEPTEVFTFTYRDNGGETWEQELTITIEGRTDETIDTRFNFVQSATSANLVVHNENPDAGTQTIRTGTGDDIILASTRAESENNAETIRTGNGNDEIYGGGGNDVINAGEGNDYLNGGTGRDILTGGTGNDIFVLGITNTQESDLDIVTDFASGDKIEVDTASGTETTLTTLMSAANIRWTQTSNYITSTSSNDATAHDTVIYATQGTTDDTSDDIVLMVLEDYNTALTISDFEIV